MAYSKIYNVELEKILLSYIIKDYTVLGEIPHINSNDFTPNVNKNVFDAIKACLANEKKGFSKFLLIEKLNSLNIKIGGEIEPSIYIGALDLLGRDVTAEAAIGVAKKLKGVTVRRKLNEMALQIGEMTRNDNGKKTVDLVNDVSQVFNKEINLIDSNDDEPVDIYENMEKVIESIVSTPEEVGIEPPFPLYQKAFGNFDPSDVTVFVARPKQGKSTMMLSMMNDFAAKFSKDDFICLILDTEMQLKRSIWRGAAQQTGIAEYFFKNGYWAKNEMMSTKVRELWKIIPPLKEKVFHYFCAGKTLEEQVSIVKRFYQKYVAGTKKKFIVVVDYIKLGSADLDNAKNISMFLEVGLKIDRWKTVSSDLNCHIITSCQSNKLGEGDQGKTDGTIVSLSDMISQFASTILLLKKLSVDRKLMLNNIDATHSLIHIYTRNLGEDVNFLSTVKYTVQEYGKPKDEFIENFLLYKFDNFKVTEVGDFKTWAENNRIIDVNLTEDKVSLKKDKDLF